MTIKRGVTFYSYQKTYYKGERNLEELVRITSEVVGAEGIEMMLEQTPVGQFPNPTDADVDWWFGLMDKYKTKPVCYVGFVDWFLYKNRVCTLKEQVEMMERDLRLAAKFGFKVLRVLSPLRKEVFEASIPIAEHYDVKMALEVHAPLMLHCRWTDEYYEMFERSGSKHVGICPDFGIFQKRPVKKRVDDCLKAGANEKIINYISESYTAGVSIYKIAEDVKKMGAGLLEMPLVMSLMRSRYNDPEDLRSVAKYLVHFHGKFWEMDEENNETSIDYENPIKVLKEIGYDGYIDSEYEGQGMYSGDEEDDEIEQVRRHQAMMKRYIGA